MRHTMQTEPMFTASQPSPASEALAMSALQSTRDAIARWSGKAVPAAGALARDVTRVSPQSLWLAQTRRGLEAFIEHGGFAQFDGTGTALPASPPAAIYRSQTEKLNACMD
jgi:hypothetical protein